MWRFEAASGPGGVPSEPRLCGGLRRRTATLSRLGVRPGSGQGGRAGVVGQVGRRRGSGGDDAVPGPGGKGVGQTKSSRSRNRTLAPVVLLGIDSVGCDPAERVFPRFGEPVPPGEAGPDLRKIVRLRRRLSLALTG